VLRRPIEPAALIQVDLVRARRGSGTIRRSKLTLRGSHQHLFEIGPRNKIERGKLNVLTEGSFIRSWSTFETLSLFRDQFFRGKLLSRGEGLGGGTFTSGSTPVPSQLVLEMGLMARAKGTPIIKMVVNAVT